MVTFPVQSDSGDLLGPGQFRLAYPHHITMQLFYTYARRMEWCGDGMPLMLLAQCFQ